MKTVKIIPTLLFLFVPQCSATEVDAQTLKRWAEGLDANLEQAIAFKICALGETCEAPAAVTQEDDEEIQLGLSAAFATDSGRERTKFLQSNDQEFQALEAAEISERQEELCSLARGPGSSVSTFAADCICGTSTNEDSFIYCEAVLEQEFTTFHQSRVRERKLEAATTTSLRGQPRNTAVTRTCDIECDIGGVSCDSFSDPEDSELDFVLKAIGGAGLAKQGGSITGACSVPLKPLPLEASLEVTASFGGVDIESQQIIRSGALDTFASVKAGICLPGAKDEALEVVYDILEFFGIDRCPMTLEGTVHPLLGTFSAEVKARIHVFYANVEMTYLFDQSVRNDLNLCSDVASCTRDENRDCAMCQGDLYAAGSIGIRFLFFDWKWDIFETNAVDSCATGDGDQCGSGLGEATGLADGTFCLAGTSCNNCENGYSWWVGAGSTFCGQEPCWEDNTFCLAGTSCKECCNRAYNGEGTRCGGEPWVDGRICGIGTTCNLCKNPSSFWVGKFFTACGTEPCWEDNTFCLAGTSCKECCNGAYNGLGTKCGGSAWSDGTLCGLGTTCNLCKNPSSWWIGKAFTACGTEPCWSPGTVCGYGTTCNSCCKGADCPWYQFGVCTCK